MADSTPSDCNASEAPRAAPAASATSTPASHSSSSGAGPRAPSRKIKRSCIMCHGRKVRCDKKLPCTTCRRSGALCSYPPGDKPPTRQPKSTIADIASRLVQLERTLVAVSSDTIQAPKPHVDESPSRQLAAAVNHGRPPDEGGPLSRASSVDDILVNQGPSTRYINDLPLSRMLEEVGAQEMPVKDDTANQYAQKGRRIQSAIPTPRCLEADESGVTPQVPPLSLLAMLPGSPTDSDDIRRFYPSTYRATQLWDTFVRRVDCICKVLHIPSIQLEVYTAINAQYVVPPDMHCLLFSIFFSATTSLSPDDTLHMLGVAKHIAIGHFRQGLEISLARANILDMPTIKGLQALGLFLKIYRAINNGRSGWILAGVALRAAQSIGMHRDGTNFGLSPFDCEIRRRLFWYLSSLNGRACEDHGLVISQLDPATDIQLPLNVDDSALDPAMTTPPTPQQGWTEMTGVLSSYESGRALQHLRSIRHSSKQRPSEAQRREVVEKLRGRVEAMLSKCNPVLPSQRALLIISRVMLMKADFVSRQEWSGASASRKTECNEETLLNAVEIVELNFQLTTDELLSDFAWVGEAYPQYHMAIYILWYLSLHPIGPLADRAWAAVDGAFAQEESRKRRQGQADSGPKWALLGAMKEKALRARDISEDGSIAVQVPSIDDPDSSDTQAPTNLAVVIGEDYSIDAVRAGAIDWEGSLVDWNWMVEDSTGRQYMLQQGPF